MNLALFRRALPSQHKALALHSPKHFLLNHPLNNRAKPRPRSPAPVVCSAVLRCLLLRFQPVGPAVRFAQAGLGVAAGDPGSLRFAQGAASRLRVSGSEDSRGEERRRGGLWEGDEGVGGWVKDCGLYRRSDE